MTASTVTSEDDNYSRSRSRASSADYSLDEDHDDEDDDYRSVMIPLETELPASWASSSPMAASLSAKKRRALFALATPFVFAVAFRLVNNDLMLPDAGPRKRPVSGRTAVDVNAPPVGLPEGETSEHLKQVKKSEVEEVRYTNNNFSFLSNARAAPPSSSRSASLKMEEQPLPVVIDRGEKLHQGVGGKRLNAADALMCRQNVIDYVINATNAKDECNGLQKAFDEFCSHDDEDEDTALLHPDQQNANNDHKDEDIWLGQRRNRRRLLTRQRQWQRRNVFQVAQGLTSWTALLEEATRCLRTVLEWLHWSYRPKFYAADAVFDVFPDALTRTIRRERRRRKLQEQQQRVVNAQGQSVVNYTSVAPQEIALNQTTTTTTITKPKPSKPHNSLSVPTGKQHLSEKTLEETLMLQHDETALSNLKKAGNQTNFTATASAGVSTTTPMTAAQINADTSANAQAETSEIVPTTLNEQTSLEVRACCASILNVYHENCNVDAEEEISDKRLFIVVLIMAFCGMVKSLIRHFKIRWLPEAAGCILVGVVSGYAASFFPHQDFSFDGNWFLRILVPPIGEFLDIFVLL